MPPKDHDSPAHPHNVDLADVAPLGIDAEGIVERDTPCRACGYNLRGLTTQSRCPECNETVAISAAPAWLTHASPALVKRLTVAVRRLAETTIISGFCVGLGAFASVLLARAFPAMPYLAGLAIVAVAVVRAHAVWVLTGSELRSPTAGVATLARLARWSDLALVAAYAAVAAAFTDPMFTILISRFGGGFVITTLALFASTLLLAWYWQLRFMAAFAVGIPALATSKRLRVLSIWVACGGLLIVGVPLLIGLLQVPGVPAENALVALASVVLSVLAVAAVVMLPFLLLNTAVMYDEMHENLRISCDVATRHEAERRNRGETP